MYAGFWWQTPEGRRPWGSPRHRRGNNIKIALKQVRTVSTGFIWLSIGTVAGFCDHGNDPSGPKNSWNF